MRHSRLLVLLALLLTAALLTAAAQAESALAGLWHSGCDFLFHTDNVTVNGKATLSLDGQLFKTAQLHYIQDGYRSHYGLKLLTPQKDGSMQETGWIILADENDGVYVMETYYPGLYRSGTATAQNSLLRRSVQLDALVELGGFLVGPVEQLLPEGTVTLGEKDGNSTVRIHVERGQTPDLAVSALNLAANLLADRWFAPGHANVNLSDGVHGLAFDSYVTVTQALTDGTEQWNLQEADVTFAMDPQGRLAAVSGTALVESVFWDGSIREVTARFDLTMTDYGESHVDLFDPEAYGLEPRWPYSEEEDWEPEEDLGYSLDEGEWEALRNRTVELIAGQGYAVEGGSDWGGWYTEHGVSIYLNEPEDEFLASFSWDGALLTLDKLAAEWYFVEEHVLESGQIPPETVAQARECMTAFMEQALPDLPFHAEELEPRSMYTPEGGDTYVLFSDEANVCCFVIRMTSPFRVEFFDIELVGN